MESIQVSLTNLSDLFHKRMASFEAELPKAQGTLSMASLSAEYTSFKTFIIELMTQFQQQLDLLAHNVDSMEMRSRRKMLLLHGISEEDKEDLSAVVVKLVQQHLKIPNFNTGDIRRCHRMGRSTSNLKPRPIVIKFQTITIRDSLWHAKTKLKGSGITISEFLTKQRHEIFMAARQKFGLSQCWTKEGVIHIIATDGIRHRVTSLSEFNKIIHPDAEKPITPAKPVAKSKRAISQKK